MDLYTSAATTTTLSALLPTALRIVLRQRGDVAALAHVVDSLADLVRLDDWTVEATAERGHVHMLQYLAQRKATRDPQCPHLRFNFDDAITRAALHGHTDAIQWLLAYRPDDLIAARAMEAAAQGGHLEIVQWLHANEDAESCTTDAMNRAAANGHLAVVEWLHANRTGGCTYAAMCAAVGHLASVPLPHTHTADSDAQAALTIAASKGHLHVMNWLYEAHLRTTSRETDAQWLEGRRAKSSYWTSTIDMAASGGHLHVIEWLCARGADLCTKKAMDEAAYGGFLDIVQWLYEHRRPTEPCSHRAMNEAAGDGHLETVRWLIEVQGLDRAARAGHLEVIRYLHDNGHAGCTERAMEYAVRENHMRVVKWLVAHRPAQFSTERALKAALKTARRRSRPRIEAWLSQILVQAQRSETSAT